MKQRFTRSASIFLLGIFAFSSVFAGNVPRYPEQPCWNNSANAYSNNENTTTGQAPMSTGNPTNSDNTRDPVNVATGSFGYSAQDLFIPGRGLNLELNRIYGSVNKVEGPFGWGWTHNYNIYLICTSDGTTNYVTRHNPQGSQDKFTQNSDGTYIAPAGCFDTLTKVANGYTIKDKHGNTSTFDRFGKLLTLSDRNNNTIILSYDNLNRLTTITDPLNRTVIFAYNSVNKIATITDFTSRVWSYAYDGNNNLVTITTPVTDLYTQGLVTTYAYDAKHNLVSVTDPNSSIYIANTYDLYDRVVTQQYGEGLSTFVYEPGRTGVIDPNGHEVFYHINSDGLTTEYVSPYGVDPGDYNTAYITLHEYNSNKLLIKTTLPQGNQALYEYDTKGNTTKTTQKAIAGSGDSDLITQFTHDPAYNFIKTVTDPKGNVTTYNYDAKGNLTQIVYPAPATGGVSPAVNFTYNNFGQVGTATNPAGTVTKYDYDGATGYLTRVTNDYGGDTKLNAVTVFAYDNRGNVNTITDAKNNAISFAYNSLNQVTTATSPAPFNYQSKYTYDPNGNLIKLQKQANDTGTQWQTVDCVYDVLDHLIQVKQYLGSDSSTALATSFQYDSNGNKIRVTDANGKYTVYTYDERNLLKTVTDALGNTTTYVYNPNGNPQSIQDANLNITAYSYDSFDRLSKTTYPDSSFEGRSYDANSNLLSKRNRNGDIINYACDNLNRLVTKTYPDNNAINYTYDINSRLTSVVGANNYSPAINYVYDSLNRIISVTTQNKTIGYEYDKTGNRTKLTYPDNSFITFQYDNLKRLSTIKDQTNATITSYNYDALSRRIGLNYANGTSISYSYDSLNRLIALTNPNVLTNSVRNYTYDNVGNILTMTTAQGVHTYGYDDIYQLTSAMRPTGSLFPNTGYNYDKLGNRTTMTNGAATTYTANSLNQYATVNSDNLNYDPNGNLTGYAGKTFSYDYENRLTSVIASGSDAISYGYDALGCRIIKTSGGVTTNFLYDGDDLIAEYDSNGNMTAKYIYGENIDEPIKMTRGGVDYYYSFDHLGSVVGLTNQAGAKVEEYDYDIYGKVNIPSAIGNPYLFTGREYDSETGFYHYRNRAYSPDLGRFLQTDPLQLDDENTYAYVYNSPNNYTDPYGLAAMVPGVLPPIDVKQPVPGANVPKPVSPVTKSVTKAPASQEALTPSEQVQGQGQPQIQQPSSEEDDSGDSWFAKLRRAIKKVREKLGKLPKGKPGKFGSPQRGNTKKGYRLDPGHSGRSSDDPESKPHINWWDYTNGKRGKGGDSGSIPIE